jgi:hypothetical protein
VESIKKEISKDASLAEFQGKHPVPFQLREIVEQRANIWVQRLYDLCCDAYKSRGKTLSADFDRAVWFYRVEPFIMGETDSQIHSGTMGGFLNLLLCAVGSPPERRPSLTVNQKECCFDVRRKVYETWHDKLHHLPPRINEAAAVMAQANARGARPARIAAGLPPEPLPLKQVPTEPARIAPESPQVSHASEQNPPLPRKECDYSSLLDSAGLTELQRECYSLRHEYQLPVAEIARRLQRDRKTIQEHIDAADNKVTLSANKERRQKRRARFGLE